ncbi:MFS transporter [Mycolicibacterium sp.]|uniref:MFS transporter n=1 Tax=Mycolicibacterium sp. TaxID=2320850 RepID=UPI003D0FE8AE
MNTQHLIDDAPLNGFHKKLTLFSCGGPFLDGYALTIIGIAFVTLKPALELNSTQTGLVGAAALIGIFIGGSVFGFVTDKIGRKTMYIADLVLLVVLSLASAFVENAWQLILLRVLLGVAIGADYPIASSLLAEFIPRKYRGRLLGALFVVWAAGAAAAAVVGWGLSHLGDDAWRYMLASPAIFGVLTLVMRAGTPESPRWLITKGKTAEADVVCKQVWGPGASVEQIAAEPSSARFGEIFTGVYLRRLLFCGIFYTAHVIPLFAVYTFGPGILEEMGIAGGNTYAAEVIISALFLVGGVPGLLLVDKIGRKTLLVVTFVIMAACFLYMAVFPTAPPGTLLLALCVYAVTSGACNFIEIIYPNELFPTPIRASATGVVVAISRIGSAISTFALPLILVHSGLAGVSWLLAGANVVGLLVTVLLGEETRGRSLSETSAARITDVDVFTDDPRRTAPPLR